MPVSHAFPRRIVRNNHRPKAGLHSAIQVWTSALVTTFFCRHGRNRRGKLWNGGPAKGRPDQHQDRRSKFYVIFMWIDEKTSLCVLLRESIGVHKLRKVEANLSICETLTRRTWRSFVLIDVFSESFRK